MSNSSNIEWTDATWNPVRGCVQVSPGCAHCYAETFAERFRGVPGHPYAQGFDLRLVPEKLTEPLRWKKPRRIFVNSMSDLFQDGVPDDFIKSVFTVMAIAKQHTFQILTKRPDRMRALLSSWRADDMYDFWYAFDDGAREVQAWPLPNVWLGPSIENDHFAGLRFPIACELGEAGWNVMVSMEPLLSAVQIPGRFLALGPRAWVIVGGESGRGARHFDLAWARSIVQQCQAANVPCFVKQLGACPRTDEFNGPTTPEGWPLTERPATTATGGLLLRSRKGGDPTEWPADLRVREFPA